MDSSPSQPPEKLREIIICHQGKLSWKHQDKKARLLGLGFPKSRSKHEMKNSGKIWNQIEPLFPIISPFLPHYPSPPHRHTHIHTHTPSRNRLKLSGWSTGSRNRGAVSIGWQFVGLMDRSESEIRNPAPLLKGESSIHNHLRTLYTSGQQPLEPDIRRWAPIDSQSAACGSSGDMSLIPLVQFNPHVKA